MVDHCELIIGEPESGEWISSSPRSLRVEKRRINYNPSNWDIVDVSNRGLNDVDKILQIYETIKGAKYDWLGLILNMGILNFKNMSNKCIMESRDRFVCSECCAYLLGIDEPCSFDPGDLAQWAGIGR